MSDREILDGKKKFALLYRRPESSTGDEKFRAMFSKEYCCFVMRYIQLFIGKYIDLFTRKESCPAISEGTEFHARGFTQDSYEYNNIIDISYIYKLFSK